MERGEESSGGGILLAEPWHYVIELSVIPTPTLFVEVRPLTAHFLFLPCRLDACMRNCQQGGRNSLNVSDVEVGREVRLNRNGLC